jgi:hypothetical protein
MTALPTLPTLTMDGQRDDWTCTCGNQPHTDGFYICDPVGHIMEDWQDYSAWDGELLACARCTSIIRMV